MNHFPEKSQAIKKGRERLPTASYLQIHKRKHSTLRANHTFGRTAIIISSVKSTPKVPKGGCKSVHQTTFLKQKLLSDAQKITKSKTACQAGFSKVT